MLSRIWFQTFLLNSLTIPTDLSGPKVKYNLHYGWCTGRHFRATTRHNTSFSITLFAMGTELVPKLHFSHSIVCFYRRLCR